MARGKKIFNHFFCCPPKSLVVLIKSYCEREHKKVENKQVKLKVDAEDLF